MQPQKRKRSLMSTLNHIERYHHRRMVMTIHVVLSVGVQFSIWTNWFASYAVRGVGFENNFFADRLIIAVALMLFLIGHGVILRLSESKDRAVVQALLAHEAEEDQYEVSYAHLTDTDTNDEEEYIAEHRKSLFNH